MHDYKLLHGDCMKYMQALESPAEFIPEQSVDLIFADPPYFLSDGGTTCHSGKRAIVDKGEWDKSGGFDVDLSFHEKWLGLARATLKPGGTIFVSGTFHCIFQLGYLMQQMGYQILNMITWEKNNPPPNLACRYFTHSTETVIWAAPSKSKKLLHTFNYDLMKKINEGKQMKDVWRIPVVPKSEKALGGHPTQKPIALLERIILAASNAGDLVFDPFCGSGTTGVAAVRLGRRFIGIDQDEKYIEISRRRILDSIERRKIDDMIGESRDITIKTSIET